MGEAAERFLERERAQLPPWLVVGFGCGIAAWLALDGPAAWAAVICLGFGLAVAGFGFGIGRLERAAAWLGLAAAVGCSLVWARAEWVAAAKLERPLVTSFEARVERVEPLAAKGDLRLTLAPADPALPPRVRVSIKAEGAPDGIAAGAKLRLRARLAPPPPMALPGTHDFARDAWFKGIGAVGRSLGSVEVVEGRSAGGLDSLRERLGVHIRAELPGSPGTIATALATGDQHAVSEEDADAMRRSGLAHLLSVSGLHIAAAIGAAMLLTLKLLALSERLALRFNLLLFAAAVGAVVGIAYTLVTGAQVPTVRSCIAALLVLAGIALGRDAISLRLVAVGALVVLLFRPEALGGASFQFSFAAVTAIVALHSSPLGKAFMRREEGLAARGGRFLLGMVATGLVVELALIPFALYHFHKAGLYGVAANLVAIPLTTFVIMPLEAGALLLDLAGLGAPMWWLAGKALGLLLWIAHTVAGAKGAVATLASMPGWAFAVMVLGGLWLCLWTRAERLWGLVPFAIGAAGAALSQTPDLLVTGDGRHLALVAPDGTPMLLRDRSGDFMRSLMSEASGHDEEPGLLSEAPAVGACSRDACTAIIKRGGAEWRLLATRSSQRIDWPVLVRACAEADIAVSDRRLPRGCTPRWLKLDRETLARTGGVAITFGREPRVDTVAERLGRHPWAGVTQRP